jgi:RNA polymerase sigma-70 factor (ECF subfamily)
MIDSAQSAYQRYGPALLRKATRMLGNREDAADVVQGLFADLWAKHDQRIGELPYLYRAVGNRCLNIIRDGRRRQALLDRDYILPSRIDSQPFHLTTLAELAELFDDKTMEILICRYVDEMTQEEIAIHLGQSRRTVGKKLRKIQDALADLQSDLQTKPSRAQ